jgi:hypothetical protein
LFYIPRDKIGKNIHFVQVAVEHSLDKRQKLVGLLQSDRLSSENFVSYLAGQQKSDCVFGLRRREKKLQGNWGKKQTKQKQRAPTWRRSLRPPRPSASP